jgi:acyl-CoA synthetase (AMP-forming)/AMP-acid ligase II
MVVVVATAREGGTPDTARLLAMCRERLPAYMVPTRIEPRAVPLPRNANGKIDRKLLAAELRGAQEGESR